MRSVVPPVNGVHGERSADDLEDLLRAYFRSRLPEPWPELKLPAAHSGAALWSSRFALAAAVGFLLLSSLAISSFFRGPAAPGGGLPPGLSAQRELFEPPQAEIDLPR